MATFEPREPYTEAELNQLYPKNLRLQLVQVLLRHGERTPVSARFRNAGLSAYWPYCSSARQLTSVIIAQNGKSEWNELQYRRRLETFGSDDNPVVAAGSGGEYDAICQPGELTDQGRATTLALGKRLRHLYVDQLGYMPKTIADADMIYLRSTPVPRALESVQQCFWGMYPPEARTGAFPPPTILVRSPGDETLYPNDSACRRFAQLSRAFAQRTADRWNDSPDMQYLNKKIGKWMPEDSNTVKVDSRPRISGIMDTVNATLSHGKATRLPSEFYDSKAREIIDKIAVEEWYSGYGESREYRKLGIGSLVGDIVSRMVGHVEKNETDGILEIGGEDGHLGKGRGGETGIRLALSGCHDTTLAAILTSMGAFDGEKWPPFTSHIAVELFQKQDGKSSSEATSSSSRTQSSSQTSSKLQASSWWSSLFGSSPASSTPQSIGRRRVNELTQKEQDQLDGYYVRLRYNDRIMKVPGCRQPGKHLEGDESMCTLEAFKAIADKFTTRNWKEACVSNLGSPAFPEKPEPAGYE